jgi:hypothetical protein
MDASADAIHTQVRERFASLAINPAAEKRFEIGRASAIKLGYDAPLLDALGSRSGCTLASVAR